MFFNANYKPFRVSQNMLKIGITGGIGSGKTVVAGIFNILGIPVFDADRQAKFIMEADKELVLSIQKAFGENSYVGGKLNRSYISNIVFNDPTKIQELNALVHPVTIMAANQWMETQIAPFVIKEAALMFETGSASNLDYVIGVYTPQEIRIKRVMERDHVSRDQVISRMTYQIEESIKMKLCDFVVINDEQQLLIPQVLLLHEKFIREDKQKK